MNSVQFYNRQTLNFITQKTGQLILIKLEDVMISDILCDARHEILQYLKDSAYMYEEPAINKEIKAVVEHMDAVRSRLDTPPRL